MTQSVSRYSRTGSPGVSRIAQANTIGHGDLLSRCAADHTVGHGDSCPPVLFRWFYVHAGTPVNAVTTGSSALTISSPTVRKYGIGAP
ncbi:hypothetical protein GCM10009863_15820 [Streptomyces axinellae]|uniref:Uncharacterized protein n=1 Tax=Streptomyces axinellae TaxID=552788 RepID=A0ABP6CAB7_9ACTN